MNSGGKDLEKDNDAEEYQEWFGATSRLLLGQELAAVAGEEHAGLPPLLLLLLRQLLEGEDLGHAGLGGRCRGVVGADAPLLQGLILVPYPHHGPQLRGEEGRDGGGVLSLLFLLLLFLVPLPLQATIGQVFVSHLSKETMVCETNPYRLVRQSYKQIRSDSNLFCADRQKNL